MSQSDATPYGDSALSYYQAGFAPIPLPHHKKAPVPEGTIGHDAPWPSRADIEAWIEDRASGNIGLRLPFNVIGLDVDHYIKTRSDGTTIEKTGFDTLMSLTAQYGPLPATYISTSREGDQSGIRLYRVEPGTTFTLALKDIDYIQHHQRYICAAPSIHEETGRPYEWIAPDGTRSTSITFTVGDLPLIPKTWQDALSTPTLTTSPTKASNEDAQQLLDSALADRRDICWNQTKLFTDALQAISTGSEGSRHEAALRYVGRLLRLHDQGHEGVGTSLQHLGITFIEQVGPDRPGGKPEAAKEWKSILYSLATIVAADPTPASMKRCCLTDFQVAAMSTPDFDVHSPDAQAMPELTRRINEYTLNEIARREAKRIVDEQDVARSFQPLTYTRDLREELAIPEVEQAWAIKDLLPLGGNALLTARAKAGKTTMMAHLLKCVADGSPFLGTFDINPNAGRIAFFNYEVDERQFRRWLRTLGIANPDRVSVLNLRGKRKVLASESTQKEFISILEGWQADTWIIDPFARAYVGSGKENDNTDHGIFCDTLDYIKAQAGVQNLVLVHHTGRAAELPGADQHGRGAKRLEDWADSLWKYAVQDKARFFSAEGRDVLQEEQQVTFDPATLSLKFGGWDRRTVKQMTNEERVHEFILATPGCKARDIQDGTRLTDKTAKKAIDALVRQHKVRIEHDGPSKKHYSNTITPFEFGEAS